MSNVIRTNPSSNTYKYVSVGIYALIAFISLVSGNWSSISELFTSALTLFFGNGDAIVGALSMIQYSVAQILTPLGAIVLAVMVFTVQSKNLLFWFNVGWAIFIMPFTWLATYLYAITSHLPIPVDLNLILFQNSVSPFVGFTIILLVAASTIAAYLGKKTVFEDSAQTVSQPVEANYSGAVSQLPMITLILAFTFPIIGIITGHLALTQMKRGQISLQNKSMATAGLVISYAITVFSFIIAFGFLAWLSMLANWSSY